MHPYFPFFISIFYNQVSTLRLLIFIVGYRLFIAENLFKKFRKELIFDYNLITKRQAKLAIFEYIEIYYKGKRGHSSLGYMSPESYEIILLNFKNAA